MGKQVGCVCESGGTSALQVFICSQMKGAAGRLLLAGERVPASLSPSCFPRARKGRGVSDSWGFSEAKTPTSPRWFEERRRCQEPARPFPLFS